MTEGPQRTLSGYKSKVSEPGDFENPNEGKPVLNEFDEYVLRLAKFPHVVTKRQSKEKKDGTKYVEEIEQAVCEFEEKNTKNIVVAFFRVDRLNFSPDNESYQSGAIKFFRKIGRPMTEGAEPNWDNLFVVGMRFRSRVVVGVDIKDGKKIPNHKYYLDVPTCRPLLPSDKEGEDFQKEIPAETSTATLANALLLAKGAKDGHEALNKLKVANASKEVTLAFFNADLAGQVTYPI